MYYVKRQEFCCHSQQRMKPPLIVPRQTSSLRCLSVTLPALLVLLGMAPNLGAVGIESLRGSLRGEVRSTAGVPQFGAAVVLYNRLEKQIGKVITDERGQFQFGRLSADHYSLRVTQTTFVPATKRSILVQPGMQHLLAIKLSSVLSSVELVSTVPQSAGSMTEDWKWALRTGIATRPVLRFQDVSSITKPRRTERSDSRGMLRVSAGDGGPWSAAGANPDVGTAFSVSTPMENFGGDLMFSGNVGYVADSGTPMAAFRTTWNNGNGPRIHMTARQLLRPDRGFSTKAPSLRMVALGAHDRLELSEKVSLDYGASMESSFFFERATMMSAFGRITFAPGKEDRFQMAFSNGSMPIDLFFGDSAESDMQRDMAALSLLPRFSRVDGHTRIQQSRNLELGYQRTVGSRSIALSAHHETIRDAVGTVTSNNAEWDDSAIQDFNSRGLIANLGRYRSVGAIVSMTQRFGETMDFTMAVGNSGVLGLQDRNLTLPSTELLRDQIRMKNRQWAAVRFAGVAPLIGTRFAASYQWTETRALTPTHIYLTQPIAAEAGLNVRLRQPIPRLFGMPGRLEANIEGRNLRAEGYLPIAFANGQSAMLVHSPRALRAGFSYSF
jgi:hypothetical protein